MLQQSTMTGKQHSSWGPQPGPFGIKSSSSRWFVVKGSIDAICCGQCSIARVLRLMEMPNAFGPRAAGF